MNSQGDGAAERLEEGLRSHRAELSEFEREHFSSSCIMSFYDYLLKAEEEISIFSRSDKDRVFERHLFESLVIASTVASRLAVSRETKILDAGSGPGLPGYLFQCMNQAPQVTLMDSSRRKLGYLERFLEDSASPKPAFLYGRVEEVARGFDVAIARALAPFPVVAELLLGSVKKRGGWIALSAGRMQTAEDRAISDYLSLLGIVSRETIPLPRLDFLGERNIILLQRGGEVRRGYPRPWKKLKEEIAKWQKSSQ